MTPAARRALLAWYDAHKRPLPFRVDVSSYRTWVSEIMLQQTTMAVVLPKYAAFLARFPDVAALAAAPEDEVLRLWQGLGYYSRARNLRKAAQKIVSEHGGRFPDTFDAVLALPGVGRYTAGAILSIAFGKKHAVLDGNVARVFSRLFALRAASDRELWARAESLVDAARPGDWNQALMELGAMVCVPEGPSCGACPVSRWCAARAQGVQDELPVPAKRKEPVDLAWTCLWIERGGRVLLHKRGERERFLRGHWGLPEARHLKAAPGALLKTVRHTITHHRITVEVRRAEPPPALPADAEWVERPRLKERLVSSLFLKSLVVK